jgi:hypothetical protein
MKTLKTLVLKTATVTGVKPAASADRIGLGLGVATTYPMDNLSQGQFPMPQNPEPEQVRSREQLSAMQPRMRLQSGDESVPPAGSTGCFPGSSAVRFALSRASRFTGWQRTTRTAATGRCRIAVLSRTHVSGDLRHDNRLGRDCQSPDRSSDKRLAIRGVSSAATAGK